ncbi:MAG: TonB-dependent receptor plug domain-containing protein [Flavobacteriales bacterium]|nr:TonB-dependent receptor plug domain-containing protein [Flavobacteriales bacterium]
MRFKDLRIIPILLFMLLPVITVHAQYYNSLSGFVRSRDNSQPLSGATIRVDQLKIEALTNQHGFYHLSAPSGRYLVQINYPGFVGFRDSILIDSIQQMNFRLEKDLLLDGLESNHSLHSEDVLTDVISNKIDVPIDLLEDIPNVLSVQDALKGLQLLPGVDFSSDGGNDLFVRGSEAGQNLLRLDGAPVYSMGHAYGYFSNFDPMALRSIQLYKGVAPARFGGRVGGILDMTSRLGNPDEVYAHLGINPMMFNLNAQMPISESGATMAVNVRRTYIDILLAPFLVGDQLALGDIQMGLKFPLKNQSELHLNYYYGSDKYKLNLDGDSGTSVEYTFGDKLQNHTASLRLNKVVNNKIFVSSQVYFSGFNQESFFEELNLAPGNGEPRRVYNLLEFFAGETGFNFDVEYYKNNTHTYRMGWQNGLRLLNTGRLTEERYSMTNSLMSSEFIGSEKMKLPLESSFYFEDDWVINKDLRVNLGGRLPIYIHNGAFRAIPEPRLSLRKKIDPKTAIKTSYGWTNQFVHLYNNGTSTLASIIWVPVDKDVKPVSTHQITASLVRNLGEDFQWQNDLYYKSIQNLPLYIIGDPNNYFEYKDNLHTGKGNAYGFESLIKKHHGYFTGWMGYALSWSNRDFEDINAGESFPAATDRRHQFKMSWMLTVPQLTLSGNLVMSTGSPFSLPVSVYRDIEGREVLNYDQINNYRGVTYQRFDVRLLYSWGLDDFDMNHSLEFTIYNLTNRENPYAIEASFNGDQGSYEAFNLSSFKLLPSLAYRLTL